MFALVNSGQRALFRVQALSSRSQGLCHGPLSGECRLRSACLVVVAIITAILVELGAAPFSVAALGSASTQLAIVASAGVAQLCPCGYRC